MMGVCGMRLGMCLIWVFITQGPRGSGIYLVSLVRRNGRMRVTTEVYGGFKSITNIVC